MRTPRTFLIAAAAASVLLALVGCSSSPDASPGGTTPTTEATTQAPQLSGSLTIFAAASLKAAFDEIATEFEAENPGVTIAPITYDGSSTLVTQITQGAAVDVFASADEANMKKLTDAGLASGPTLFASNSLVVAVPTGNPANVTTLADLGRSDVTVVICAPEVPCGAASKTLLANEGVAVTPVSLEQNVTAVLTKVAADEADAGLVYATDVKTRTDVESFVPDGAADVVNRNPIVALKDSQNPDAAQAFVDFVLGAKGQAVLLGLGFGTP